jgi:hypothetical protein
MMVRELWKASTMILKTGIALKDDALRGSAVLVISH